jgi:hypothetical protein
VRRTALFMTVREKYIAYCWCRGFVKLFTFLLSPYSLVGTCSSVQNCTFHDCAEQYIAYCWCRGFVKLFRFLVSPYSLVETCNSVQRGTTGGTRYDQSIINVEIARVM